MTTVNTEADSESQSAPAPVEEASAWASGDIEDMPWKDAPRIVASGLCMGTADLVPGVSGGTMAVALGIYRQFLAAIDSGPKALRAAWPLDVAAFLRVLHWRFIAALGLGVLLALIVMGKIVGLPHLVSTNPQQVYAVFFGLVLASTVVLRRHVAQWSAPVAVSLLAGAVLGYIVVQLVPAQTPDNPGFIFLCGMISITAMILPGISGSFMLLVLGKYETIINGVLSADLGIAVPFLLGCALGITAFSRVLGALLDRFPNTMTAGLMGLLLGSLIRIWPFQHLRTETIREKPRVIEAVPYWPEHWEAQIPLLMLFGLALVLGIEWLAMQRRQARAQEK